MESEIATQGRGTGFDVPEQRLHLRPAGRDAAGRMVRRGVVDTSMGPVMVEEAGGRLWTTEAIHTAVVTEDHAGDEDLIAIAEQFVALEMEDGRMVGTIVTAEGDAPFIQ